MRYFNFLCAAAIVAVIAASCRRDEIRPDHFVSESRSPLLDSLLDNATPVSADFDALLLPDGSNLKEFLLKINPGLDSLFPRTGDHPFYELTGNDLKDLLIGYMTVRAANAYNIVPDQYPGDGNFEPAQDKLGYAAGSRQTDVRTPGVGSLPGCPQIFGLDEEGFIRHLLEGAYLTLAQNFDPYFFIFYNEALGFTGLSHELEFAEYPDIAQENILAGDIFALHTRSQGTDYFHYGLVMNTSDDPSTLMLADCFADVSNQDCKTDVGINVGPRLVSLSFLLGDIQDIEDVNYTVIRLKKKFYQPFTGGTDNQFGFQTVRYGNKIWMAEDLEFNGYKLFFWDNLDLANFPSRGICPDGWHIPSKDEWDELFRSLNSNPYPWIQLSGQHVQYYPGIGKFMKNPVNWGPPANNLYGFNVPASGFVNVDGSLTGLFEAMGYWTSTSSGPDAAYSILFEKSHDDVLMDPADLKTLGYGCRCVKDLPSQQGDCLKIPIVFHFLKCSQDPTHPINNLDISSIYDQLTYLNDLFRFNDYCVEFYLACENDQPVFEVHDVCDGTFPTVDPARYIHSTGSLNYTSGYLQEFVVSTIQSGVFEWDPDRYINVYIGVTNNGAIAAFPGENREYDAIVMPREWIGGDRVAYEFLNQARTMSLAHEIGHYLDLQHPWEPADLDSLPTQGAILCPTMNNGISDLTPIYGNVFADSVYSCVTGQLIYNNNIMSYGDYGVATVLTPGQIQHMQDILNTPAGSNGRAGLVRTTRECE